MPPVHAYHHTVHATSWSLPRVRPSHQSDHASCPSIPKCLSIPQVSVHTPSTSCLSIPAVCPSQLSVHVTRLSMSIQPVHPCHQFGPCHGSIHVTCPSVPHVCLCHLSVHATRPSLPPVCPSHLSVNATCPFIPPARPYHVPIHATCLSMPPVGPYHLPVHTTCTNVHLFKLCRSTARLSPLQNENTKCSVGTHLRWPKSGFSRRAGYKVP